MPASLPDLLAGLGPDVSDHVLRAIGAVPRHHFVAEIFCDEVYKNTALPIGHGVNASRPSVIAKMLTLLGQPAKVLEIGTGCGWQTALLSTFAETYSIEINAALYERAARDLRPYRVHLKHDDGMMGWAEHAPFDGILLSAAAPECPPVLFDQLSADGVMVFPLVAADRQELCRVTKRNGKSPEMLGAARFVRAA